MIDVGLYGKLPSHGDFLRRRAPEAFVGAWDVWLQHCMAASRSALGDRWLDVYLTSPVWRFACGPGAAGHTPIVGVMAPSVDRVGRYFPLTIVASLPDDISLVSVALEAERFFSRATQLVVDTLEAEVVDFERFDTDVARLGDELEFLGLPRAVDLEASAAVALADGSATAWQVPIASPADLGSTLLQLLSHRLSERYAPLTLWWTEGSSDVEPGCLIVKGLPQPDRFGAMLDGSWAERRWELLPARVDRAGEPDLAIIGGPVPLGYRSAAKTDVGRARRINQDAFVERPDVGVWAVADGMGGHADGEVASRMVCDALADLVPAGTLDATTDAIRERLDAVNAQLVRTAAQSLLADVCGSTVVVLVVRGNRMAVLWAGDSRVYRWRAGRLQQLTTDHSVPVTLAGRPESNGVTRAVGAESALRLDVVAGEVQAGDRFLLCSDGLTRTVSDGQIQQSMAGADVMATVEALVAASLAAGAPDNVTALVAEALADTPKIY